MPPAPKSEESVRARKDTRAKKVLILLVPLLAALVVWQGPKIVKQVSSAQEKAGTVQGKVVQGFEELVPEGVPKTTPEAGSAAELAVSASLEDTDPAPEPAEGELISFTRFAASDPFVQLVDEDEETVTPNAGTSEPTGSSGSSTAGGTGSTSGSTGTTTSGDVEVLATIRINGAVVVVEVGGTFPENDPAFELVAVEDGVAKIGLVSGTFSNDVETLDLQVGDTVTLISQPDGARFTLKLVELSS